jgi:hypothetical protein
MKSLHPGFAPQGLRAHLASETRRDFIKLGLLIYFVKLSLQSLFRRLSSRHLTKARGELSWVRIVVTQLLCNVVVTQLLGVPFRDQLFIYDTCHMSKSHIRMRKMRNYQWMDKYKWDKFKKGVSRLPTSADVNTRWLLSFDWSAALSRALILSKSSVHLSAVISKSGDGPIQTNNVSTRWKKRSEINAFLWRKIDQLRRYLDLVRTKDWMPKLLPGLSIEAIMIKRDVKRSQTTRWALEPGSIRNDEFSLCALTSVEWTNTLICWMMN